MDLYVIAGPNGVGKTTFATKFLPKYTDCANFINADLIAKGNVSILTGGCGDSGWPVGTERD